MTLAEAIVREFSMGFQVSTKVFIAFLAALLICNALSPEKVRGQAYATRVLDSQPSPRHWSQWGGPSGDFQFNARII